MEAVSVLQRLAVATSRTDKEQIVFDAFMHECAEFFLGARLALDPLVCFDLTKAAEIVEDDGTGDLSFAEFMELAHRVWRQQLIGTAARDAINAAAERCHAPTWNLFYRRILLKNLKVIDAKIINKVLNKLASSQSVQEYLIPLFGCQMPQAAQAKHLRGYKLLDTKLDGVRMLAVLDTTVATVALFTRTGQIIPNFTELRDGLYALLPKLPGPVVLDGQLTSPQGAKDLTMIVRQKETVPQARYALFDVLPLTDFRNGHSPIGQRDRHSMLEMMQHYGLWQITAGRVSVVPQVEVDLDSQEGQQALVEFVRQARAEGHGVMVKEPDAPYLMKRNAGWLTLHHPVSAGCVATANCTIDTDQLDG